MDAQHLTCLLDRCHFSPEGLRLLAYFPDQRGVGRLTQFSVWTITQSDGHVTTLEYYLFRQLKKIAVVITDDPIEPALGGDKSKMRVHSSLGARMSGKHDAILMTEATGVKAYEHVATLKIG